MRELCAEMCQTPINGMPHCNVASAATVRPGKAYIRLADLFTALDARLARLYDWFA